MKTAKFKDSPLGPIPQDWEVKRLGEIAPLQRGFDLPTKELQEGPFPVVYSNGICNYHVEAMCDAPGLVTGRSGTIGHFTFIESGRYWPHNTALWVTSFKGNDPLYIKYLYETLHFENFATGSGVPTLNRNAIHEYKVALPSKIKEQQRIAEALGEVDKLIESLDEQIEKKRLIAKGVAHDLLSGKKRLPGFEPAGGRIQDRGYDSSLPEGWVMKRLGDAAKINRGGSPRPIESWLTTSTDGINWIKIGDVAEGAKYICSTEERIVPEAVQFSRVVKPGDFLLSNSMSFGRPYILKIAGCIHDGWLTIQDYKDTFDCEYLYYILGSEAVFQQYVALADGSSVKNLNKDKVEKVLVPCPFLPEQQAIADLLGEQDAAIAALEAKREKYVRIQEGMMRDLLTGKVRMKGE